MVFYAAVVRGCSPGIYTDWDEYQKQVKNFSMCLHMTFDTKEEATDFLTRSMNGVVDKRCLDIAQGSSSNQRNNNNEAKFQFDENGNVVVYTAGFCPTSQIPARAGVGVFFGHDSPLNFSGRVQGRATNNTANIQAVTHALKTVVNAGFDQVVIYTSSQYVIDCMTHYVIEWKKQNWINGVSNEERPNKEDLLNLDGATKGIMVKYQHVSNDNSGHKEAKKLAKIGCNKQDPGVTE